MNIQQIGLDKKGYFKASKDGKVAGIMTFHLKNENHLVIDHTKVEEAFRSNDIGWQLLQFAVKMAREKKYSIIPECHYAKTMFKFKKSIQDVLSPSAPL